MSSPLEVILTAITAVATAVAAWAAYRAVRLTQRNAREERLDRELDRLRDMVEAVQNEGPASRARLRGFVTGRNKGKFPYTEAIAVSDQYAADVPGHAILELDAEIERVEKGLSAAAAPDWWEQFKAGLRERLKRH